VFLQDYNSWVLSVWQVATTRWRGTQAYINFTALPPLYWLVKHDRDKLSLKPVCDPQGNDRPRVLLFYVEVVEYHRLRRREDAGVVVARWEAQ